MNNVIPVYHDELGHVGVEKTMEGILNTYWFPCMKQTVHEYIRNCIKCSISTFSAEKSEGEMQVIEKGSTPLETLHIDHFGPLEKTPDGFRFVLVVVDAFTKYSWLFAAKSTGAQEVVDNMKYLFGMFGAPKRVVSDRGTVFTSQVFAMS
jgi:transposase InsO family protein